MIEIRKIKKSDFEKAMNILDNELGKERVRSSSFLYEKFKKFPFFFIGIFLKNKLIGIICGFPRGDYLLISEIAICKKFHKKGLGKKLVKEFEKVAKRKKYKKINVGARDDSIKFYSLLKYKPFLLMQCKEGAREIESKNKDFEKELKKYRKKYPKAKFQYIFTKFL